MKKKEKTKWMKPKMKFNPGLQGYEVDLPTKKSDEKKDMKKELRNFLIILLFLAIGTAIAIWLANKI